MLIPRRRAVHVHASGRLGNQLFLAAAAQALASRMQARVIWHGSRGDLETVRRLLPVRIDSVRRHGLVRRLLDREARPMAERGLLPRTLFSLWWRSQSVCRETLADEDGAVAGIRPASRVLIRDFHQRFENVAAALTALDRGAGYRAALPPALLARVAQESPIGVHMRFGDFLTPSALTSWGQLAPEWFAAAIRELRGLGHMDSPIWVFSDDPEAARIALAVNGISPALIVAELGLDVTQELGLLAACPAKVISSSTFSWWAGYLSDPAAAVVAPQPLMRAGERESAADPRWMRLPAVWWER